MLKKVLVNHLSGTWYWSISDLHFMYVWTVHVLGHRYLLITLWIVVCGISVWKVRRERDFLSDECIQYFLLKCVVTQGTSAPKPFTHISLHYKVRWRLGYVTRMLLSVRRRNHAFNDDNDINAMCILMNRVILLTPTSASYHSLSDTLGLRRLIPCPRCFRINSNDYDLCHKIEKNIKP
jgi:hypothetical protein